MANKNDPAVLPTSGAVVEQDDGWGSFSMRTDSNRVTGNTTEAGIAIFQSSVLSAAILDSGDPGRQFLMAGKYLTDTRDGVAPPVLDVPADQRRDAVQAAEAIYVASLDAIRGIAGQAVRQQFAAKGLDVVADGNSRLLKAA